MFIRNALKSASSNVASLIINFAASENKKSGFKKYIKMRKTF